MCCLQPTAQCNTWYARNFAKTHGKCLEVLAADLLELLALMPILAQPAHGTLQSLPGYTLACSSFAYYHVTMPGHFAVKDLNDLGDKLWHNLLATDGLSGTFMYHPA